MVAAASLCGCVTALLVTPVAVTGQFARRAVWLATGGRASLAPRDNAIAYPGPLTVARLLGLIVA